MRNLPEERMWDKMKGRLRNYEEEPDDQWDAIAAKVSAASSSSHDHATRSLWVILVLLIGWLAVSHDAQDVRKESQKGDLTANISKTIPARNGGDTSNLVREMQPKSRPLQYQEEKVMGHIQHQPTTTRVEEEKAISAALQAHHTRASVTMHNGVNSNNHSDESLSTLVDYHAIVSVHSDSLLRMHVVSQQEGEIDDIVVRNVSDTSRLRHSEHTPDDVAKEEKKTQRKGRSLLMYGSVTPTLAYYNISPDTKDDIHLKELKSPGVFASDRLGFVLDAGIHKPLTRHIEVFAGISYYHQRQSIYYTFYSGDRSNVEKAEGGTYTVTPGTATNRIRYTMKNIGVTAGFLYTLKTAALDHQFGLALQYQYGLAKAGGENAIDNEAVSYLNYQILYRLRWNVSPRLDFYVQPSYTTSFISQENAYQPFSVKPSRAGIGIGFIYSVR